MPLSRSEIEKALSANAKNRKERNESLSKAKIKKRLYDSEDSIRSVSERRAEDYFRSRDFANERRLQAAEVLKRRRQQSINNYWDNYNKYDHSNDPIMRAALDATKPKTAIDRNRPLYAQNQQPYRYNHLDDIRNRILHQPRRDVERTQAINNYWDNYKQHHNKPETKKDLGYIPVTPEQMKKFKGQSIGNLSAKDYVENRVEGKSEKKDTLGKIIADDWKRASRTTNRFGETITPVLENTGNPTGRNSLDMDKFKVDGISDERLDEFTKNVPTSQDEAYSYMTEDEKDRYNALYAVFGKNKAEEFRNTLMDSINSRIAKEEYENKYQEDNVISKTLHAGGMGVKKGIRGLGELPNFLLGTENTKATPVDEYVQRELINDPNNNVVERAAYNVADSIGYMVPGAVASVATGGVAGNLLFGLAQAGNAYREDINAGKDSNLATLHGIQQGVDEAVTNYLLGGINAFGGGQLKKLVADTEVGRALVNGLDSLASTPKGKAMLNKLGNYLADATSEGAQEYLQFFTENLTRNILYNENNSMNPLDPEAWYSALLGAVTSGVMNTGIDATGYATHAVPNAIVKTINDYNSANIAMNNVLDDISTANDILEASNTAETEDTVSAEEITARVLDEAQRAETEGAKVAEEPKIDEELVVSIPENGKIELSEEVKESIPENAKPDEETEIIIREAVDEAVKNKFDGKTVNATEEASIAKQPVIKKETESLTNVPDINERAKLFPDKAAEVYKHNYNNQDIITYDTYMRRAYELGAQGEILVLAINKDEKFKAFSAENAEAVTDMWKAGIANSKKSIKLPENGKENGDVRRIEDTELHNKEGVRESSVRGNAVSEVFRGIQTEDVPGDEGRGDTASVPGEEGMGVSRPSLEPIEAGTSGGRSNGNSEGGDLRVRTGTGDIRGGVNSEVTVGKEFTYEGKNYRIDSINNGYVSLFDKTGPYPIWRRERVSTVEGWFRNGFDSPNNETKATKAKPKKKAEASTRVETKKPEIVKKTKAKENVTEDSSKTLKEETEVKKPETLEDQTKQKIEVEAQVNPKGDNYILTEKSKFPTTEKSRFKANVKAINTLKVLQAEDRIATAEEKETLAQYTGWGGLSGAFDDKNTKWKKEAKLLKETLTEDEYKNANRSIFDAYYTEPSIITGIYNGLEKMGFNGGRLLEPSSGTGRFIGAMPEKMLPAVKSWTAVELDNITGNIAKYMYPQADVRIQGFEKTQFPKNYFDVVIGNVPFGDLGIADIKYPKFITNKIHNYFIAKSIDTVRDGGLVCVITTSGTLDSYDKKVRKYFAEKADLVGAIRLPNTAFKGTGTSVTSDILVFKKRAEGMPYSGEDFISTSSIQPSNGGYFNVNDYFMNHPEMVLGTFEKIKGQYGDELTVVPYEGKGSLKTQIEKAFKKINAKIEYPKVRDSETVKREIKASKDLKEGAVTSSDGKFFKNVGGKLETIDIPENKIETMNSIIKIRDAARALVHDMRYGTDAEIKKSREELNAAYDKFVKKYGYLNKQNNKKILEHDSDSNFLLSLEKYDAKKKTAKKADIFRINTISRDNIVTSVNTVPEAVVVSMNELGYVSSKRVAELMGLSESEAENKLLNSEEVFLDIDGNYVPSAIYLSGNVRAKLKDAEYLAETNPKYKKNVKALKEVVPKDISASEIAMRIGATWIPDEVYSQFASELMGVGKDYEGKWGINVVYNQLSGTYDVNVNDYRISYASNTSEWGTKDRSFVGKDSSIFTSLLNNKSIEIKHEGKTDLAATAAANEKADKILDKFKTWVVSDEKRSKELSAIYNDTFNNLVPPKFDGSHLTIDGMATNIKLREHQKNAIQRIVSSGSNVLLQHGTGAGKTFAMIGAAMKMRQLGLAKKPMFIVPINKKTDWKNDFYTAFPGAKVLVCDAVDLNPKNRKVFANKVITGDWDAIIMHNEQFEKIPISPEYEMQFLNEQVAMCENALNSDTSRGKSLSAKAITKKLEKIKTRLDEAQQKAKNKSDDDIFFDEMGIDALFIDEAQAYKNLFYISSMSRVSDMGSPEGNQRTFDLYSKINIINGMTGGKNIVFATATPIMNSIVEAYTMQRYLQADLLKQKGIDYFDAWANQFAEIKQIPKLNVSGTSYEMKTSLYQYKNLPEFMQMYTSMTDIVNIEDIDEIKLPKIKGGQRTIVTVKPTTYQKEFVYDLGERVKEIKKAGFKGMTDDGDHMFKVLSDGKKISYSQKFIDPSLPYEPEGKIAKVVENVTRIYNETTDFIDVNGELQHNGIQLVFIDDGVPNDVNKAKGLNVYADIKTMLMENGIPENEIAFIHDYPTDTKKEALYEELREGKVRVLLGSTGKMGTGLNVQERAAAIHEVNPVARPGDLEQNEGRVIRQGNLFPEVEVLVYVTEGTLDARQWDGLKRKSNFIHQVTSGKYNGRSVEMDSELTLSAAEISAIASGNPLILEQFEISDKIKSLQDLEAAHYGEVATAKSNISKLQTLIATNKELLPKYEEDLKTRKDIKGDKFKATIKGVTYDNRTDAGNAIIEEAKKIRSLTSLTVEREEIGDIAGFKLIVTSNERMILLGAAAYDNTINYESATGTISKLTNLIDGIDKRAEESRTRIEAGEKDIVKYQKIAESDFSRADELKKLYAREAELKKLLTEGESSGNSNDVQEFRDISQADNWTVKKNKGKEEGKKTKTLSEIVAKIEHDYDINISKGHLNNSKSLGQFNKKTNGIRVGVVNNLPTISHELGHFFDKTYNITDKTEMPSNIKSELVQALGDKTSLYSADKYYSEGFAELIREYLKDSSATTLKYPNAVDYFLKKLSAKELAEFQQIAEDIHSYFVNTDTPTSAIRLREEKVRDFRTAKEKAEDAKDLILQKFTDSNHAIRKLTKETGKPNAYILATNAAYSDAIAGRIIESDLTDPNGKYVGFGLKTALAKINTLDIDEYREFGEYLVCKHGPERLARDKRVFTDDRFNNAEYMNKRAAELEEKYPAFEESAKLLYEFIDNFNMTWGVKTGLIDKGTYEKLKKMYPHYVPLNRAIAKEGKHKGAKKGFANQRSPYSRAKGSGADIYVPVDNVIDDIVKIVNTAVRNNVLLEMRNVAESMGTDATFMEKIPEPKISHGINISKIKGDIDEVVFTQAMTGKIDKEAYIELETMIQSIDDIQMQFERGKAHGNIVTVLVNGKPEFWEINDPMLLESITSMNEPERNAFLRFYAATTRLITSSITGKNVIWSIFSNAPRDLMTFTAYSKNKNFVELIKGLGSAYLNSYREAFRDGKNVDPLYSEYLALGGGHTSVYSADANLAKKARKKLTSTKAQRAFNAINPLNTLSFISDTIELGPRFATYKVLRNAGLNEQEAFYEAMDITVNFRRSGEVGRSANKIMPFFNANVQGIDKFVRYYTAEDMTGEARKKAIRSRVSGFIAVSIITGVIEYAINNYDDEREKEYEQLSNYTKNNFWLVPLGNGKFFSTPKSRELAVPSSFVTRTLERTVGKNDKAFGEFGSYFADNMLPPIVNDVAKFVIETPSKGLDESFDNFLASAVGSAGIVGIGANMMANRDFLGRPIESQTMRPPEAKDRYTKATSKLAFYIGQTFKASPQMIDYAGEQLFAYIWKPMKALTPVGDEYIDRTLGVKNTYVKDNVYSTDVVNNLFTSREKSSQKAVSNPDDINAVVKAKMDADMVRFYTTFNKLNKDVTNTEAKRHARQTVLTMITDYLDGKETESFKVVKNICEHFDDTTLLPGIMSNVVKDDNKTPYKLTDSQYVEYQTTYNNYYYNFIEDTIRQGDSMEKQRATLKAAKEHAMDKATAAMLKKVAGLTTKAIEKQGSVSDDDYIIFQRELELARDDGSLKQQEVIDIIYDMYDRGIGRKEANELFHVRYESDKNNPFATNKGYKKK